MAVVITEECPGTPEAQALIRLLLARIAEQDRRIAALEAEVARWKKTPRNSSFSVSMAFIASLIALPMFSPSGSLSR